MVDIFPIQNVRVVDGDTLECNISLPFDTNISKRIRLRGWWADEPKGPFAALGLAAKQRLEDFCHGKGLWIHSPGCRMDKYGRVIAHLMEGERIITAKEVLGDLQLSEKEHKLRRDIAARTPRQIDPSGRNGCPRCGDPMGDEDGCVICCPKPPYRFP